MRAHYLVLDKYPSGNICADQRYTVVGVKRATEVVAVQAAFRAARDAGQVRGDLGYVTARRALGVMQEIYGDAGANWNTLHMSVTSVDEATRILTAR